ncbi:MAG: arginine--tRNA ligase [Elusimicrobia bacterium RIFOXYB12_FULL_50_12]|nr:MAG: arginine--tRNA ligase [Elusimicrobia bacterium RIFOXYA12_FULL_49_49]OGS16516.1 MAG: arginine--tRNA ligase [Elusimicrobia bacterium RIFOXYA2_FULL_47_53]OGS26045.1 MAG: arginine--tRNA ligase [Elusimicrobia bacterium RIFOXYB12_FULL_50_12]OGS29663.1 MAG: arginine--tRNA ligase [Elusimicrobia bacterium RIFOXYB2_FULL_46_23]
MKNQFRKSLDGIFSKWASARGIEALPQYSLEQPPKNIGGDLACNIAMLLSKQLKANPRKIAEELVPLIDKELSGLTQPSRIAGAGFINLTFLDSFVYDGLKNILEKKDSFGRADAGLGEKVLIEFVSANPTGPLHIGHGRGAAIGDSLSRIYSFMGYDAKREYYLNDVGNQMRMLASSVEARYLEQKGENFTFPEDGYKGEYIRDIAKSFLEKRLEPSEDNFRKFAVSEIMNGINSDLSAFRVSFDSWFSEATIALDKNADGGKNTQVESVCEWLKDGGFAYEQDGALWFASSRYGDDKDRVLKRSDGRFTYLASDIAYHKNKLERGYSKLIDLWGADHHGYVARMKAAVQALGSSPDKLVVILYQLVSLVRDGKPVAMSTRSGEFVTLKEVLDEVGTDACRFFFMLRAPDSQLEFDLDLAKKQSSENPVFYVQYVHARSHSIFAQSGISFEENFARGTDFEVLTAPEELELIRKMIFFPDILELCLKSLSPHHLTAYLMELADSYHAFYEKCRVITEDKKLVRARLALIKAVTVVIENGLGLLGVSAPRKM